MPLVSLPDGNTLDVPDDATPEQLAQVKTKLASTYGAPQKPAGWLESTARDALTGFGQGAATIARGAQTAAGALPFINDQEGFGKGGTASNPQNNPLARMLGSAAESAEGLYKDVGSKSTNPPMVQGAVRGAAGALTQGPGTVVDLAAGAGSGAAGEAMEKYAPNNPLAKTGAEVLGGIIAGTGAGMATRLRPQSAAMAREALEGITDADLRAASAYMREANQAGMAIDLAQALVATRGDAGNLESIRNALAHRSQGNRVQEVLRGQPESMKLRADMELSQLPGTDWSAAQNASNLQKTATEAISLAKAERSTLWVDTVKKSTELLKASEQVKVGQARAFQEATGVTVAAARNEVKRLTGALQNSKKTDQTVVQSLNAELAEAQKRLAALGEFTLPRGTTTTNRGNYSDLSQRGQSIVYDALGREVKRDNLSAPQLVKEAPSLETLSLEKELGTAQSALGAAETGFNQAARATGAAETMANATSRIPPRTLDNVSATLEDLIARFPGAVEGQELAALRRNLTTENGMLTDPEQINRVLTQFTTRLKSPDLKTAGMDAGTAKYLNGVVMKMREELGQGFKPIREANDAFVNFTESTVNPLKQGVVGRLAQPSGYNPETGAAVSKFDGLMNAGTPTNAKVSDIRTMGKELAKVDPDAFESSFKGWLGRKLDEVSTSSSEGLPVGEVDPQRLYNNLFAKPNVWKGIKDAASVMAEVRGIDVTSYMRGLESFKQLTKAVSSRADPVGISGEDLKRLGGSSATADFVRLASFAPMNRVGNRMEAYTLRRTLQDFDKILTSPEGADMLMQLGRVPVMSKKAQAILGTWGGMAGNSYGLSNSNPPE